MRIPSSVVAALLSVGLLVPAGAQTQVQQVIQGGGHQMAKPAAKPRRAKPERTAPSKGDGKAGSEAKAGRVVLPRDGGTKKGGGGGNKTGGASADQGGSPGRSHGDYPPTEKPPKQKPPKDKPPKDTPPRGSEDSGKAPAHDPEQGRTHDGDMPPRRHAPKWGVVIGPSYPPRDEPEEEKADKKKSDKAKADKPKKDKKADEEPAVSNLAGGPVQPAVVDSPDLAIPKYTCPTFRRIVDAMFASGHVASGLSILELMKEKEYFLYTGSLLMLDTARTEPGPAGDLAYASDRQKSKKKDEPADPADAGKDKKKKKGKKSDGAAAEAPAAGAASTYAQGDWRGPFEEYADQVLALTDELARLEADAAALGTPEGRARRDDAKARLDKATSDLDVLVAALAGQFGKKDPRVRRLSSSETLMAQLGQMHGAVGIYTVSAPERLWLILVTPTSRRAFSSPTPAAELAAKVTALATALRDKTANPIPAARALYGPLFGPIETELKALGAGTLLWSLDGPLRYVPVAALHDGSRYVVESYACASLSRASVARLADRPSRPWRGVGLGVSQKIGQFAPLPSVADELDGIFGAASDGDPVRGEVLLDARFTEQAFESAVRGAPPVVHVATHFQLVPGKADDSLLLLGDGSLLTVGDIRRMKDAFKGIELLALSACETAVPSDQDGKEVECFATIAQNRGARAVLASLWPVNDRSTSALMQAFYRAREAQAGPTKAEALREAQLKLLSGEIKGTGAAPDRALVHGDAKGAGTFVKDPNAPFAHPYYWASFIMLGNPR